MNLKLLTLLALGASIPTVVFAQEERMNPEVGELNKVNRDETDLYRKSERE